MLKKCLFFAFAKTCLGELRRMAVMYSHRLGKKGQISSGVMRQIVFPTFPFFSDEVLFIYFSTANRLKEII